MFGCLPLVTRLSVVICYDLTSQAWSSRGACNGAISLKSLLALQSRGRSPAARRSRNVYGGLACLPGMAGYEVFRDGLKQLGWVEGRNVLMFDRSVASAR